MVFVFSFFSEASTRNQERQTGVGPTWKCMVVKQPEAIAFTENWSLTRFGLWVTQLTLVMLNEKGRASWWERQPRHLSYRVVHARPCPRCTCLRMQLLTTQTAPFTGAKTVLGEFKEISSPMAIFKEFSFKVC